MSPITKRPAKRQAFCRGCDSVIKKEELMVTTYSYRNRGQSIHFCLKCASDIGELANVSNSSN